MSEVTAPTLAVGAGAPSPRPVLSLPARIADGAVWLYQKTLSPVLAAAFPSWGCRFHPTCSHYAREALREHGFLAGGALSLRRLARCGPWHPGGLDPVPSHRCSRVLPSSPSPACPSLVQRVAPNALSRSDAAWGQAAPPRA